MCYRLGAVWRERGGRQFVTETLVTSYNLDWGLTRLLFILVLALE